MEKSFLSCFLHGAEHGQIETRLQADDFENKVYGRIFETILKQWKDGLAPTLLTLSYELAPDISADTIAELTVMSDANISHYEKNILEASKTRNFIQKLQQAKEEIDKGKEADTIIKNLIPALIEVTTARNEAQIKNAAELIKTQYPEIRWIIEGFIGEGLTMINGAPKIGKSWFVLNLAIAAASGGIFLGSFRQRKQTPFTLHLRIRRGAYIAALKC